MTPKVTNLQEGRSVGVPLVDRSPLVGAFDHQSFDGRTDNGHLPGSCQAAETDVAILSKAFSRPGGHLGRSVQQ